MVKYTMELDQIFGSLADSTRRDILQRVANNELTVTEIASAYDISMAAISKHLRVLEKANLIVKQRKGKQRVVRASPLTLKEADDYLRWYEPLWNSQFDILQ